MGTVFKKKYTRDLPTDAEIIQKKGQRVARWKHKGRTRTAPVATGKDGIDRISVESACFLAKFRDGQGIVQTVSTGCKDETMARQVLADLERDAERVRAKMITPEEIDMGRHQQTPLEDHRRAYVDHLEANGCTKVHVENVGRQLKRVFSECRFTTLADLSREKAEHWLALQSRDGMGARTRNTYAIAAIAFGNWCADPLNRRLASNPFEGLAKLNEKTDVRRKRRAMTEGELVRLLYVSSHRPVAEFGRETVRKDEAEGIKKRANWETAPLTYEKMEAATLRGRECLKDNPAFLARQERLGRERTLIYKTLILTGLRKGELASLTVGQLHLDESPAYAELDAADEKNRQGATIAIRDDLAADLRQWLADRLEHLQAEAQENGEPIPMRLPESAKLFQVPEKLSKILNRDLKAAGIAKKDEQGRQLDVHAMRHTYGTWLSKGGVSPRTAQAAMRHSKLELTMQVYTDPRLLDVHGALDALPELPLDGSGREQARATGTDSRTLVPKSTPESTPESTRTRDNQRQTLSIIGRTNSSEDVNTTRRKSLAGQKKEPADNAGQRVSDLGGTGLEPVTPSLSC